MGGAENPVLLHYKHAQFDKVGNFQTKENPGFVDMENGDFTLRRDSVVFEKIPGFKAPPFEKMGLYIDEYRDALPVKAPRLENGMTSRFRGDTSVTLVLPKHAAGIVYTTDGTMPTLDSTRYTEPFTVRDSAVLTACAVSKGAVPTLSEPTIFELKRIMAEPVRELQINFQPGEAPAADGHATDTGAVFQKREGGASYGWSRDNREAARRRGKHSDSRLDTLVHFSPHTVWEAAVANGDYNLTVCVGDSEFPCKNQTIDVEGRPFCAGVSLDAGKVKPITKRVTVRDGILTLSSNNAPHGHGLTRMNYLRLEPIE